MPNTISTAANIHSSLGNSSDRNIAPSANLLEPLTQSHINQPDNGSSLDPNPRNLGNTDRGFVKSLVEFDPPDASSNDLVAFHSKSCEYCA